jgi:uncharacterized protein (DUF934 family)
MSTVILNGQLSDQRFVHLADDAEIPAQGTVSVSWSRFNAEADALAARGNVVPRLHGDDDIQAVLPNANKLDVICLEFPKFVDGRCYSFATLLRRNGFNGQLRAVGDVLKDQVFFYTRCGIDALEIRDDRDAADALKSLNDFSVKYQAATDEPTPIYRRRA